MKTLFISQELWDLVENGCVEEGVTADYVSNLIDVVNQIRKLGENLSEKKVVEKILRSLPKKYDHVVAAIEESKYLNELTDDELLGSLYSHEDRMKRYDDTPVENAFYSKTRTYHGEKSTGESNNHGNFNRGHGGPSSHGRRGGPSGCHSSDNNQCHGSYDKIKNGSPKQCYFLQEVRAH